MAKVKVTLSTGKVVVLKEIEVGDQELALESLGDKVSSNPIQAGMKAQVELLKILIVSIDGNVLTGNQKELLKTLLDYKEYTQLLGVVSEMTQVEGKPQVELLTE